MKITMSLLQDLQTDNHVMTRAILTIKRCIMKHFIYLLSLILLFSCKRQQVNSVSYYSKWINNPDNGLFITRKINGLQLSIKYLPSEFLEYKDREGNESAHLEQNDYKNTLTFLMTIGPDEEKGNKNDIMFDEISSYKEYTERLLALNFEIDKNITLKTRDLELKPVLSNLENTYGLSKNRSIVIAFAPTDEQRKKIEKADELEFTYSDELFDMGTMHFNFSGSDINHLPYISQLNK